MRKDSNLSVAFTFPSAPIREAAGNMRRAADMLDELSGDGGALLVADIPAVLSTADGRYRRVTADKVLGSDIEIPDAAWKYTLDQETGLVWTDVLGKVDDGQNWQDSWKIAQATSILGVVCDAPSIQQQLSIIDYGRYDPAVDTRYFRGPYGWHWTRTPGVKKDGSPSGYAWAVYLGDGSSYRFRLSVHFHVRAVCPSQSLGLR